MAEFHVRELIQINNVNNETAALSKAIGEHLISVEEICSLNVIVDGREYDCLEDRVEAGSVMYAVCSSLETAETIKVETLFYYDSDEGEPKSYNEFLTDSVKPNVLIKRIAFCEDDPHVELLCFNEGGFRELKYVDNERLVKDIEKWYCCTAILRIADSEQNKNHKLYIEIINSIENLCRFFDISEDELDESLNDSWLETGEITVNLCVSFTTKAIETLIMHLKRLNELVKNAGVKEFSFKLYAIADGEDDYEYASACVDYDGNTMKKGFCIF